MLQTQVIPVVNATKVKWEEGKIYSTKDYDMLQRIPGNRHVRTSHVDELVSDIDEQDLLAENPGLVTDFEGGLGIVAGQHRKEAARILNKTFYFMYRPNLTLSSVRMLGTNTLDWTYADYLNSFIEEGGKPDYEKLQEFARSYNISIPIALAMLTDDYAHRNQVFRNFANGKFLIKDFNLADRMASLVTDVRLFCIDNAWVDRRLMLSLRKLLDKGTDPKTLTKKLKDYGLYISKRNSSGEYDMQLEHILEFQA